MKIYYNPTCLKHAPPSCPDHAVERILSVVEAIKTHNAQWAWRTPPALAAQDLYIAHTPKYVRDVTAPIQTGEHRCFAPDAIAVEGTCEAAMASAGVVGAAVNDVFNATTDQAFCIVNPPGHHAETDNASGFCFINYVALAALTAFKTNKARRIAVVDFDAHHGNGTQSLFWNHENLLYISLHEDSGLSGFANETGAWNNVLNVPLPAKCASDQFRSLFAANVSVKIADFKPDLLLVSAGFDMHEQDPLGSICLNQNDYAWIGGMLRDIAKAHCNDRLVAVLEGGYDLGALKLSVTAFLQALDRPHP